MISIESLHMHYWLERKKGKGKKRETHTQKEREREKERSKRGTYISPLICLPHWW
jgi:hypothetical protein